jgi:hypothetical protein
MSHAREHSHPSARATTSAGPGAGSNMGLEASSLGSQDESLHPREQICMDLGTFYLGKFIFFFHNPYGWFWARVRCLMNAVGWPAPLGGSCVTFPLLILAIVYSWGQLARKEDTRYSFLHPGVANLLLAPLGTET